MSTWDAESRAAWQQKARAIEDRGYSMLVVADHLAPSLSPLVALVSAADATRTLRVGTYVLNNDFRHPVQTAREAAAADLLTDGRFVLGIGAGFAASEYREAGLGFDEGATRVERLGEAITIVKGLLEGQRVNFRGRHYQIQDHATYPPPIQRPHPPILVGGNGRQLISLAAREADIVGLTGLSFLAGGDSVDLTGLTARAVDQRLAWIRAAAGSRFDQVRLSALVQRVIVTDHRQSAAEAAAAELGGRSADELLESPYLLIGTIDQMVEDLRRRRERWGIAEYVIFEPAVDDFAPVVARLGGS